MLEPDPRRRLKVGLFTAALLALLALVILVIGKQQGLFTRHVAYQTQFHDVAGLVPGAQVWLNGVVVGVVERVDLPEDPAQRRITVTFRVREALAGRIRADSRVRIRTLGLLGDRYLEISSGNPLQPLIPEGGMVASVEPTDIAEALTQGGEAMGNIVAITGSLRRILEKMERGEGILGALLTQPTKPGELGEKVQRVLADTSAVLEQVRQGRGLLGKLVMDPEGEVVFVQLRDATAALHRLLARLEQDLARENTLLAALLRDPQGREQLTQLLANLAQTTAALQTATSELATGEGTLPRLLRDREFAHSFLNDLGELTRSLASVVKKLDQGSGSAGQFINNPQLYQDLEHVVRGIQESSLLRWFIRNRREAGERANSKATAGGG
ncbi:MAG: MlaD family protein [Thermoanaerobaculum sp.]|nr:MlaD family protein [Thermoanaerobaculum sp.]